MFPIQAKCGLDVVKDYVHNTNTSRIYGFILYTKQNPYVAKVLRDNDFWDALDEKSGKNWPVFAVRPLDKGYYDTNTPSNPNTIGFMVQTWTEPSANKEILHEFGLSSSEDLPCFVAFMWDDNDNLQSITIPIVGKDVDSVFLSIETIVKIISDTEQRILPQYKRNVEVFRNVADELNALKFRYKMKSLGKITKMLSDFLGVFK